jgi:hypothetical protein
MLMGKNEMCTLFEKNDQCGWGNKKYALFEKK